MTYEENRQRLKNEVLNEIRKIYNPLYKFPYRTSYGWYDDVDNESRAEQRECKIRQLIESLEKSLQNVKKRNNINRRHLETN